MIFKFGKVKCILGYRIRSTLFSLFWGRLQFISDVCISDYMFTMNNGFKRVRKNGNLVEYFFADLARWKLFFGLTKCNNLCNSRFSTLFWEVDCHRRSTVTKTGPQRNSNGIRNSNQNEIHASPLTLFCMGYFWPCSIWRGTLLTIVTSWSNMFVSHIHITNKKYNANLIFQKKF